ncbi:hypothetical protein KIN20_035303 [Parelaphostrongylus tenuis]|uniref:Uncharacterized protein n=1 Tax=Parelaphostrongylus tenuis TaxID=148309 RepID=A0AAD5RAZ0_PARTN|nr:hypothetical protein KIN20_035303 [Parelaphostrongylus tenuis]
MNGGGARGRHPSPLAAQAFDNRRHQGNGIVSSTKDASYRELYLPLHNTYRDPSQLNLIERDYGYKKSLNQKSCGKGTVEPKACFVIACITKQLTKACHTGFYELKRRPQQQSSKGKNTPKH